MLPFLLPLPLQVGRHPLSESGASGFSVVARLTHRALPLTLPTGAAADPAPQEAARGPALAPGPSRTPQGGDVGHGPGAPPRRKISVLTVQ